MSVWGSVRKNSTDKTVAFSIGALAAAIPVFFWLGGCIATRRPAWFMRRSSVERFKEALTDARSRAFERRANHRLFSFLKH